MVSRQHRPCAPRRARGFTLIEVLVTIVIMGFGLLGLAALQMRMQASEMEAYQRSQALMLLDDIASRIATNRAHAAAYVIPGSAPLGAAADCASMPTGTRAQQDLKQWCSALQGAAEVTGTGASAVQQGAMIGGRGCIELAPDGDYLVTVAWQGLTPISAPPASVDCGAGAYDTTHCANDLCRRTVTTVVRIATLT